MLNITLLALGARYIHHSPAPYYLKAALLDTHHSVRILDHSVNEKSADVLADIVAASPDVLGLSAYIWNISYLKELIPLVKERLPDIRIVLGGPEVSYNAQETLQTIPLCDAVLCGEGEIPFRSYCEAVEGKRLLSSVEGIAYRTESGIFCGAPYVGAETPPSPVDAGYAEALKGRIAYIESSRGCPFSCAFCLSGRCGGVRFFDMERTKRDILALAKVSRTVKFVDRTFNAKASHAIEILTFILSRYGNEIPKDTCFHFELSGELLSEELLSLFSSAPRGLFQAEIGLQSFHAPTLRAIRRSDKTERLTQNIARLLKNGNMHVHIDLIAGLPEESLADFEKSFESAYALSPHMLQLGFLKLLHGAPLREEKEKYPCKYGADPPYEVISTPALSEEDLAYIHVAEKGLDHVYNSGRYRRTLALWHEKENAFSALSLFYELGKRLSELPKGYTVNDEISAIYTFFLQMGVEENGLRDAMLLDFISTNSSRLTPTALRKESALYGRVKAALSLRVPPKSGVRRAVVILSSEEYAAYADYEKKDSVLGTYPLSLVKISDLISAN